MRYELYYWPGIQGRGEFIRLALEEGAARYVDVARLSKRDGGGMPSLMRFLQDDAVKRRPFAPPYLKAGKLVIGQTANILLFLGPRLGLVPKDEASRLWAHQLQLTVTDLVSEVHETHHPIASSLYYHQQKREAVRRARHFTAERVPKYLDYFEQVVADNRGRQGPPGRQDAVLCRSVDVSGDRRAAVCVPEDDDAVGAGVSRVAGAAREGGGSPERRCLSRLAEADCVQRIRGFSGTIRSSMVEEAGGSDAYLHDRCRRNGVGLRRPARACGV